MVFEEFVWKTSPGAWDDDPPVAGRGALVDDRDVGPARGGQFVGERRSHDARSDDDHSGSRHRRTSAFKQFSCCQRNMLQVAQLTMPVAEVGVKGPSRP